MATSGRYLLRSDVVTRTVRLDRDGDEMIMTRCSVCDLDIELDELTSDGLPICRWCLADLHEAHCTACGTAIDAERAVQSMCPECEQADDDQDATEMMRSPR